MSTQKALHKHSSPAWFLHLLWNAWGFISSSILMIPTKHNCAIYSPLPTWHAFFFFYFNPSFICRYPILCVWSPGIPHTGINLPQRKPDLLIYKGCWKNMSQHMLTISSKGWQSCCLILCGYYKQWQLLTFWYFRNCNTKILMIHRVWNLDNLHSVPSKKSKSVPGKQLYRFSIPAWFSCLVENITKLTGVSGLLCCNATAVSIIMKVYHSFLDVSKWLVPSDFGY